MSSTAEKKETKKEQLLSSDILLRAFELMATAKSMADIYEENAKVTSKYVHATSRGHEACQLALGLQLVPSTGNAAPELEAALSSSFAFGGTNSVLAFKRT